ncbi:ATP-dependent RNA helicase HrpA [Bifidobacterium crudilactis]|uniref:ATP-dependent RNA helicase HrpA n=1 Tax=Bifidobacterium crudilactis TaxID=327277 RepID=UPI00264A09A7|nr:ATP-dependent RNA helicase HrpA [Bifidobacterium crudilactis]MDN5972824.1 ATP-dependent RNA helicase HrpA [Bifidobacterium crudilactis]MDN6000121.1 ATP-dependent RNA helicase HrpA [Bifidobacterium crudilactis]MDN6209018.1 ATP-dependent RNA helicase HrpA [Bifidobacterium crudilactis]MDN6467245.1 ATP-dependent RNA helicase HrpA [Bifidobacterium crudilactis]MDN6521707.1 ATP-dependent RNA helicase HrpA [Bifidobacterium crudilactis]
MIFDYPQELPVSAAKEDIEAAIRRSQVVIISGQTGSGKTTQIPKILMQMGRGTHGHQIVHTQPRRIAARSVAERIASELHSKLGDEVGFQVRFTDESSSKTRLRVVTDGILLAQIQRDPKLMAYDTIVIDEAHERSLNIDFLLGYLTTLLPKRPDLKLIITSATIDSLKFSEHFSKALHKDVPVIEVSGRTYPVQIVYEPTDGLPALMQEVPGFTVSSRHGGDNVNDRENSLDMPEAVARACSELIIHSQHERGPRDVLVFAAGERDIHDYEHSLRRHFGERANDMSRSDAIEIMPLFARLSSKEQHKVFEHHQHQRIVIATNVAETSLTVPGIRYVVDPGTARISRYSKAAKVQRLPIEDISQASADQRAGRCGRLADGIAVRLYGKDDYDGRPRFTEPEILRTSLGAVVLHMLSVGVARTAQDVADFGFIDQPDMRAVSDGFNELTELGAISRRRGEVHLTKTGRQLARIPIDVRLGRMVIEASRNTPNVLACVLVIVAFLSLQDPRERPEEHREEADRCHNRYADERSDFMTALNIWDRFFQADGERSNSTLRKLCSSEYMSFIRMRQWRDLVRQLHDMTREFKFRVGEVLPSQRPAPEVQALPQNQQAAHSLTCSWDDQGIHRAMLSGLLSNIGMQVVHESKASDFTGLKGAARARAMKRASKLARNDYQGARGTRFALFPASGVSKTTPDWVMVTGLVETSRLWARYAAAIDPAWAESLAGSLTRTTYADAHWSASRGSAVATAKVLLYGLPIVQDRSVQWGSINPVEARDMLIRQGLVEGDIQQRFSYDDFVEANRSILDQAGDDASRTRRIVDAVSDEDLFDFYDRVLPAEATSLAALAHWWKSEHERQPHLLDFDPDEVERLRESTEISLDDYPDHWHTVASDGTTVALRLSYIYDPQAQNDGVTVHIPLNYLSRLPEAPFSWNVPGMLDELIVSTIKSLPKALRVQFVPAPDTAKAIRAWIDAHYPELPGTKAVSGEADDMQPWPDFSQAFTSAAIAVVGAQLHPGVFNQEQLDKLPAYTRMTFSVEKPHQGKGRHHGKSSNTVLGTSKSLHDLQLQFAKQAEDSARRQVKGKAQEAAAAGKPVEQSKLLHRAGATTQSHSSMLWQGALDLLRMPTERITSRWLGAESLMMASAPYPSTKSLVEDLQLAAVKRLLPEIHRLPDDAALQQAVSDISEVFEDTVYAVTQDTVVILRTFAQVDSAVSGPADLPLLAVLQWIKTHIGTLVHQGFLSQTPAGSLPLLEKYLRADLMRLQKAKADKARDVRWAWQAEEAEQLVSDASLKARKEPAGPLRERMVEQSTQARWMLEEFYVSLWAQELGSSGPVSIQRIRKVIAG